MKLLVVLTAVFVVASFALTEGEDPSFRCSFCQSVVNVIERGLPRGSTPEEKIHFVRGLCGRMPPYLQSRCDAFMDAHGEDIARLITEMQNNERPIDICGQLGLCRSAKEMRVEQERTTCPQCMAIVENLEHAIPKGATLQEKLDFMRGLCGRMPSLLQSPCDKFMNTYGERILKILAEVQEDADPRLICAQLDLCPYPSKDERSFGEEGQEEGPRYDERPPMQQLLFEPDWRQRECVRNVMCEVCKLVVGELEDHVLSGCEPGNCTLDEMEAYVLHLCEYMPPCHQGMCESFMKQYAYPLLDVMYNVEHKEHPGKICAMLDVCPRQYMHCKPVHDNPPRHHEPKVIPDRPLPMKDAPR